MLNKDSEVLYVGKAKQLKNRVKSYFLKNVDSVKTRLLVEKIHDFEFFITTNDSEAFILENNLIKKHAPKYNIRLRDDKSYPYLVIDKRDPFPKLQYLRNITNKKNKLIYGPFATGSNIFNIIKILTKAFNLRDCSDYEFRSRKEPCLLYQMHQCSAPCVDYISSENYIKDVNMALDFFEKDGKKSLKVLHKRMEDYARDEKFEHAAMIRDFIQTLDEFLTVSSQESAELLGEKDSNKDMDVISYFQGEIEIDLAIYIFRNGVLLGQKSFHFPVIDCFEEVEDELLSYIYRYYENLPDLPPNLILTPFKKEANAVLQNALNTLSNELELKVKSPGKKYAPMMDVTQKFAYEHQRFRDKNKDSVFEGLNKLKDLLKLKERPRTIECYDIAIFQGKSPTAAQIVFKEGKPSKKDYRYYHLQERPEGNNDFAMMEEVISRRIKYKKLPDIFVVDGGLGQVNSFKAVLDENEIDIPVVGIAKSKAKSDFQSDKVEKSEERLIIHGRVNPYFLSKNKSLLKIITYMRDEAHRFSRKLHHKHQKKNLFSSWLDEIPGIGPKTKKKILSRIEKNQDDLSLFSEDELMRFLYIKRFQAKKIREYFDKKDEE